MAFFSVLLGILSNLFAAIYFHVDENRLKSVKMSFFVLLGMSYIGGKFVWRSLCLAGYEIFQNNNMLFN